MEKREGDAIFSRDGRYRYRLTRRVGDGASAVMFLMLNPSTANAVCNDNTISKCVRFTEKWLLGVMHVVNLSPMVATDPGELFANLPEPRHVQQRNIHTIRETATESDLIVVAYGNHASRFAKIGGTRGRVGRLTGLLRDSGHRLHCFGVTAKGHPRSSWSTSIQHDTGRV